MNKREHRKIRNKVAELFKKGLSIRQISKKLKIKEGINKHDQKSVKWYILCDMRIANGKKTALLYPEIAKENGKRTMEKRKRNGTFIEFQRMVGKCKPLEDFSEMGKIGGKISAENRRKNGTLISGCSKAGKIGGKVTHERHPNLASEIGKRNIKRLKKTGKFKEWQMKGVKKMHELHPELAKEMGKRNGKKAIEKMKKEGRFLKISSKGGKNCHKIYPDLALSWIKKRRENSPYTFMDCKFDSKEEKEFCKLLVENKIIKKPIEGINCHIKVGRNDIDFFIKNKIFIEYHPPISYENKKETLRGYYKNRKKILEKNGYTNQLIVVESIRKIKPHFFNKLKNGF
ncbi:MAG: hypothetical protein KKG75_03250 [Nanoarchaeota archaeon]|nr:hypothetical protein [Nanoarchaeota archaeon]